MQISTCCNSMIIMCTEVEIKNGNFLTLLKMQQESEETVNCYSTAQCVPHHLFFYAYMYI